MADKRIARVFVRRNRHTPDDGLSFVGLPGLLIPEVDEVHVSCLFTWDKPRAERLARQWERVAPVRLGGPAYSMDGSGAGEFVPGRYLKKGYTITSRGCPRKCPFCFVSRQEGKTKELVIHDGSWIMDNNLLGCSRDHIERVFSMLEGKQDVKFVGGLDIRLLKSWHVERMSRLKLSSVFIAYDMPGTEDCLDESLRLLREGGISHGIIRCFVLAGFFGWDTPEKAENRCRLVLKLGGTPHAQYYRGPEEMNSRRPIEWTLWTRRWSWQPKIYGIAKREGIPTYQDLKKRRSDIRRHGESKVETDITNS